MITPANNQLTFTSRPRESERKTRKKAALWDRSKLIFGMVVLFGVFWWQYLVDNPIISGGEALSEQLRTRKWLLALIAFEVLRQVHYLICEHWAPYYAFWSKKVFARYEGRLSKFDPWNRYRAARAAKAIFWVAILSMIIGKWTGESAFTALLTLPKHLSGGAQILQAAIYLVFWIGFQVFFFVYLMTKGGIDVYFPDDIQTRFTDVWGQDHVLEKIKENIVFLEDPEAIESKGGYVPGGILLEGPPGTGKTLMAEAVAGETGKPYMFIEPGALNMGMPMVKVWSVFRRLRRLSLRYGGAVLFIDEADSLGNRGLPVAGSFSSIRETLANVEHVPFRYLSKNAPDLALQWELDQVRALRKGMIDDADRIERRKFFLGGGGMGGGALTSLLTQMSGLKKPRGFFNRTVRKALGMRPKPPPRYRILIIMATNIRSALDDALLRPGRIDRIYKVGYPSKPGRIRTYAGYFNKVKHELTEADIEKLAIMTPYATGAKMKDLVNEALINAVRDGRDTVTWHDVIKAKHFKDLGPKEDVEYIDRERHATALHEACHALVAYRVRHHMVIDIATVEKGADYLGMVSSIKPEDLFTEWRSEYEADIMVALASLAGERMFYGGDSTSGVSGDLWFSTTLANYMTQRWGMGHTLSVNAASDLRGLPVFSSSETTERFLKRMYDETEKLLKDNRHQLLALAHALEVYKTLDGSDVGAVIDGKRGPIVDGRPYYSDEAKAILDDYHAKQLKAHEGHEHVPLPAPQIPVLAAVSATASTQLGGGDPWAPATSRPDVPEAAEVEGSDTSAEKNDDDEKVSESSKTVRKPTFKDDVKGGYRPGQYL